MPTVNQLLATIIWRYMQSRVYAQVIHARHIRSCTDHLSSN